MIYEYICENCKASQLENRPVANRDDKTICIRCKNIMVRIISCPGLVFKGKGFYKTDYQHKKDMKKQAIKEKKAREEGKSGYREI